MYESFRHTTTVIANTTHKINRNGSRPPCGLEHHCRTVHGSAANLASAPRRSLAIHLQPIDNHWRAGASHPNDALVRPDPETGAPEYADPAIQPLLWPT